MERIHSKDRHRTLINTYLNPTDCIGLFSSDNHLRFSYISGVDKSSDYLIFQQKNNIKLVKLKTMQIIIEVSYGKLKVIQVTYLPLYQVLAVLFKTKEKRFDLALSKDTNEINTN